MYSLIVNLQNANHYFVKHRITLKKIWIKCFITAGVHGVNKKTHRAILDKPAIEYLDGKERYYHNGELYEIKKDKDYTETRKNGSKHSIGKFPAVIYLNGTKEWYNYGVLHRHDLPAIEYSNGDKEYWLYGKWHRREGPAVIYGDKQYWFKDGEFVKCIV